MMRCAQRRVRTDVKVVASTTSTLYDVRNACGMAYIARPVANAQELVELRASTQSLIETMNESPAIAEGETVSAADSAHRIKVLEKQVQVPLILIISTAFSDYQYRLF